MQNLRLTGYLSYIEGKKLTFEYLDNYDEGLDELGRKSTTRDKLKRMFDGEDHPPFDAKTFRVFVKGEPTHDIVAMTGRQVTVLVKPTRYSFVSKLAHNRGEKINGWKLSLEFIDLIKHV